MVQGQLHDIAVGRVLTQTQRPQSVVRPRAIVLLAGSVRPTRLGSALGMPLMQLPIDTQMSLLDAWGVQVQALAADGGLSRMPVRVLFDQSSPLPPAPSGAGQAAFQIEADPRDYRGTGGVLRDIAEDYDADDRLLVANGLQLLMQPLRQIIDALTALAADVALVSHRDGTPSGMMLVRCGALAPIPTTGFIDMKEQALPRIARGFSVRVAHFARPTGLPTRTLATYIQALRLYHQQLSDPGAIHDPFAENIRSSFSIVQEGAQVHSTARVHDSVVMAGAKVGPGAILVRSLVCAGGIVRREQHVIDRLIARPQAAVGEGD